MNICPISQQSIIKQKKLNCDHVFEKECIDEWLSRNNTCPICRKEQMTNVSINDSEARRTVEQILNMNASQIKKKVKLYVLQKGKKLKFSQIF